MRCAVIGRNVGFSETISSRLALLGPLLLAGAVGCSGDGGPPLGSASGRVTCKGEPVSSGTVNFASDTGFAVAAPLDSDGKYRLVSQYGSGIPLGTYKVIVMPPHTLTAEGEPAAAAPDNPRIPAKYRDFATTDLTADVKQGSNDFPFDLKE